MTKSERAILMSAKVLFWKNGLKNTTVEQICEHAGVSKMTFYRKYNNKEHAAEYVLKDILEDNLNRYREIMNQSIPFPDKIKEALLLKENETETISDTFLKEITSDDGSSLSKIIQHFSYKSYHHMLIDIKQAKKEGWIREELKPEFILDMLNSFRNKLKDEQFMKLYQTPKEAIMELTNFFFYGIMNNTKE